MRRGQLLSLGIFSALLVETTAWAQQSPTGLFLTSPLSVSGGYDENFVSNGTTLSDSAMILNTPTFSWIKSTHRMRLSADYQAEFVVFSRDQDLNSWNHAAALKYSYRINSRLSFNAGDSFLSTSDASRSLAESQLLLPLGPYRQNYFFTGLEYRLDLRTALFFRFDNSVTAFRLTGASPNLFDQMANAGTIMLDHTINRQHSVTGGYTYLHVRPVGGSGSVTFPYQAVHSLNAGYMYTVNPGLNFRLAGGVVRGREFAYTAGGAVEKRLGRLWVMAAYQRYLSFLGGFAPTGGMAGEGATFVNGLLPGSVFQAWSLRVAGKLTKRMGLEFNGQRGRTNLGDQDVRSLVVQSRLDYKLNERLIVFARADYYGQNISQFTGSPLSRRRYFGGLEIVLLRAPETEGIPLRRGRDDADPTKPQTGDPAEPEEK